MWKSIIFSLAFCLGSCETYLDMFDFANKTIHSCESPETLLQGRDPLTARETERVCKSCRHLSQKGAGLEVKVRGLCNAAARMYDTASSWGSEWPLAWPLKLCVFVNWVRLREENPSKNASYWPYIQQVMGGRPLRTLDFTDPDNTQFLKQYWKYINAVLPTNLSLPVPSHFWEWKMGEDEKSSSLF